MTVSKRTRARQCCDVDQEIGQYSSNYIYEGTARGKSEIDIRNYLTSPRDEGGLAIREDRINSIKRTNPTT